MKSPVHVLCMVRQLQRPPSMAAYWKEIAILSRMRWSRDGCVFHPMHHQWACLSLKTLAQEIQSWSHYIHLTPVAAGLMLFSMVAIHRSLWVHPMRKMGDALLCAILREKRYLKSWISGLKWCESLHKAQCLISRKYSFSSPNFMQPNTFAMTAYFYAFSV